MTLDVPSQPRPKTRRNYGPLEIGEVLENRYEILEFLGHGGFAAVYKAKHAHIGRTVAIKVLTLDFSVVQQDIFEQRFLQEAQAAATIDHPNVVTIHDFGFSGDERLPYLVMEYLEGYDLEEALQNSPNGLSPERVWSLFDPCLEALAYGHEHGIVHRDLKPANLFLAYADTDRERLVILDYGVARLSQEEGQKLTATGQIFGTPAYLSPEYITEAIVSPALDVYQMGLILVEALSGKVVVDSPSALACFQAHQHGNFEIPAALAEPPFGDFLARALALDPAERFHDAHALREAFVALPQDCLSRDTIDISLATGAFATFSAASFEPVEPSSRLTSAQEQPAAQAAKLITAASLESVGGEETPSNLSLPDPGELPSQSNRTLVIAVAVVVLLIAVAVVLLFTELSSDTDGEAAPAAEASGTTSDPATTPPPETTPPAPTPKVEAPEPPPTPEPILVAVTSQPEGGEVYLGESRLGVTPLEHAFPPEDPVTLEIRMKGYLTATLEVDPSQEVELNATLEPDPELAAKKKKRESKKKKKTREKKAEVKKKDPPKEDKDKKVLIMP